jgi:hypothetical protein
MLTVTSPSVTYTSASPGAECALIYSPLSKENIDILTLPV